MSTGSITTGPYTGRIFPDANGSPEDVREGVIVYGKDGRRIEGTQTAQGGVQHRQPGQHMVRFLSPLPDDTGSPVIAIKYVDAGGSVDFPQHRTVAGLTPDGWTHTAPQLTNIRRDIDVGALYMTSDGNTHAFTRHTPFTGLVQNVSLSTSVSGVTIDWGDGSEETVAGTSFTQSHTYAAYAAYEIIIKPTVAGQIITLGRGQSGSVLIGGSDANRRRSLTALYVGRNTLLANNACNSANSLRAIILPRGTINEIPEAGLRYCYGLSVIVIPNGVTAIGLNALSNSYALTDVCIPSTFLSLAASSMQNMYSLEQIELPESLTSIGDSAISSPYGLRSIVCLATTPPTIAATSISGLNPLCKIYVPDASLEAYKAATNWAALADYITPISQK